MVCAMRLSLRVLLLCHARKILFYSMWPTSPGNKSVLLRNLSFTQRHRSKPTEIIQNLLDTKHLAHSKQNSMLVYSPHIFAKIHQNTVITFWMLCQVFLVLSNDHCQMLLQPKSCFTTFSTESQHLRMWAYGIWQYRREIWALLDRVLPSIFLLLIIRPVLINVTEGEI